MKSQLRFYAILAAFIGAGLWLASCSQDLRWHWLELRAAMANTPAEKEEVIRLMQREIPIWRDPTKTYTLPNPPTSGPADE